MFTQRNDLHYNALCDPKVETFPLHPPFFLWKQTSWWRFEPLKEPSSAKRFLPNERKLLSNLMLTCHPHKGSWQDQGVEQLLSNWMLTCHPHKGTWQDQGVEQLLSNWMLTCHPHKGTWQDQRGRGINGSRSSNKPFKWRMCSITCFQIYIRKPAFFHGAELSWHTWRALVPPSGKHQRGGSMRQATLPVANIKGAAVCDRQHCIRLCACT